VSLRNLPEPRALQRPQNYQWEAPADVLAQWSATPRAAAEGEDVISILDVVGYDPWEGGGVTAKRISAALRSIGDKDVRVQINSPGGDLFEGIAIYNLLRGHKARVTVEVLGWAASAASIIAMAGDEIRVGRGSFVMIHNAWGVAIGNRHDFAEASELFKGFDEAIADIYAARTGRSRADIEKLMDAETFMGAQRAVDEKFADVIDDKIGSEEGGDSAAASADPRILARRQTEAALAKAGFSRSDRTRMLNQIAAPRDAGRPTAARDAGDLEAGVRQLISSMKK
jgi:ATP-dependent Clp protease, protease subunit